MRVRTGCGRSVTADYALEGDRFERKRNLLMEGIGILTLVRGGWRECIYVILSSIASLSREWERCAFTGG